MFIPIHDQNKLKYVRLQYVTLGLIALNFLIWFLTSTFSDAQTTQAREFYIGVGFIPAVVNDVAILPPELVLVPEFLTYFTYAFFHADFMHCAGNMIFLWVFGDNIEDATGHFRFLLFYLACAAAGAVAHQYAIPDAHGPLIGASGATAGVVGAYLLLHPKVKLWFLALGRIPVRLSAVWPLGAWIAYQAFQFATDQESQVSWAAHIGGFVAGMVLIVILKRRSVPLLDRNIETPDSVVLTDDGKSDAENDTRWGRQP